MRVLITGGYGFIGSHVAEKFSKEGHEVHIVDNLSTGVQANVTSKHKSYILNADDAKCRQIFDSYPFDVVIHLAQHLSPLAHEATISSTKRNVIGLVNMLQLATAYQVQKFIYVSATSLYKQSLQHVTEQSDVEAVTQNDMDLLASELYCEQFTRQCATELVILRMSHVYGSTQPPHSLMHALLSQPAAFQSESYSGRYEDFLYINDAVYSIYYAATAVQNGLFNVSAYTSYALQDIARYAVEVQSYATPSPLVAAESRICNVAFKEQFDWTTFYSLEKGLTQTIVAYDVLKQTPARKKKPPKKDFNVTPFKPYLENGLLFGALALLLFIFQVPTLTTFIFGVFYIMMIGSFYGNRQGFIAVLLAAGLLGFDYLTTGRELFSLLYDTTFLFQLSTFLLVGLVVGYSVQRKTLKMIELQEAHEELQKRYDFLDNIHSEMRDIKNELQYRLQSNEDSFGKIYSIIKELDNLEPEKIFIKTVQVVEKIMRCQGVSIFVFNKYHSFLRLVAHSNSEQPDSIPNSIKVADAEFVRYMMETGKPFVNRTLMPNAPLLAAPIYYKNDLRAIITIDQLSFQNFSTYYENLFIVVKELIQSALFRAFEFVKLAEQQRYIEQTAALQYDVFQAIVETKEEAFQQSHMPYVILTMHSVDLAELDTIVAQVEQLLRETDYISYKEKTVYILLSNMRESDLPFVYDRFNARGLYFSEQNGAHTL